MCRKKKIKCDGKMPACSHCINYKTECIFTQVEKKRNPPKGSVAHVNLYLWLMTNPSYRAKYIEGLENRLGRMESLLKMSGLLNDDDGDLGTIEKRLADKTNNQSNGGTPVDSPTRRSKSVSQPRSSIESPQTTPWLDKLPTPPDSTKSPDPQKQTEEEVEALSDRMCSLVTNNCGETRYIGRSP